MGQSLRSVIFRVLLFLKVNLPIIGIGAHNFGGRQTFLPENICKKINKMPEFLYLPEKCPNFIRLLLEKYFPEFFFGGGECAHPVCYTLHLCCLSAN